MAELSFQLDTGQINQTVTRLLRAGKTRELMQDVGRIAKTDAQLNFRSQRDPDGKPWKRIRRKGQILRDTGRLRNSINYRVTSDTAVEVGTNVEYAALHQFGFSGSVTVPQHNRLIKQAFGKPLKYPVYQTVGAHQRYMVVHARPFLGIGARALRKIEKAAEAWAQELLEP